MFEKVAEHRHGPALIEKHRLSNGLRVILWEDRRAPVFSYHTWFGVGSRHERPGRTGIAHLFEHLMFKRTKTTGEGEFDRIMEAHGADTNAATWVDWTYYREKLPSGQLDLVARLEADRMENLVLDPHQLESEREVVVNERLLRVDNDPDGFLYERLYALAYEKHPYGWPTIGWMPDIRAISLEDCLAFYRSYYAPQNATIVVVGDFASKEALETIERYYGHLEPQAPPPEALPVEPPQTAPRREQHALPISSERAMVAWHAVDSNDADLPALEVMDEILTGGESARAYVELVLDRELCTDLGGWVGASRHPGLYEIGLTMRPEARFAEADEVLAELCRELCEEPVTERELAKAKNSLEADLLREAADTGSRARGLGSAEVVHGDFRAWFRQGPEWQAVTADDVRRVARRVLRPENRTTVLGVPRPGEPEGAAS